MKYTSVFSRLNSLRNEIEENQLLGIYSCTYDNGLVAGRNTEVVTLVKQRGKASALQLLQNADYNGFRTSFNLGLQQLEGLIYSHTHLPGEQ